MSDRYVPQWLDRAAALSWRLLVVGLLVWALFKIFFWLFLVLVAAFAALVLSAVLRPGAEWLQRRGLGSGAATGLMLVAFVVVVLAFLGFVGWRFYSEGAASVDSLTSLRDRVVDWLANTPFGITESDVRAGIDQLVTRIRENIGTILSGALATTRTVLALVAGALLALVLSFFFTRDGPAMGDWVVDRLVQPSRRAVVRQALDDAYGVLGGYLLGVIIIGAFNATGVAIAMLLLGLPLVLPIWLIMFLGAFFPVVGAFVSGLAAVLVGLVAQGLTAAIILFVVVVAVQQFEGHVLQPIVMGREVPLHPAVVLLVLTAGGAIAGIAGAALAVPVAAAISAGGHRLRVGTAGAEP